MFFTKKNKNELLKMFSKIGEDMGTVMADIEILKRQYNAEHNRIDKISDYIQEKLANDIEEKAVETICEACKRYIDMKLNKQQSKKKGK